MFDFALCQSEAFSLSLFNTISYIWLRIPSDADVITPSWRGDELKSTGTTLPLLS
jgi:hypothetical protein